MVSNQPYPDRDQEGFRESFLNERLLTPAQVAAIFNVDPKTVGRWDNAGLLLAVRTPGGHRRYRASDVRAYLEAETTAATRSSAGR